MANPAPTINQINAFNATQGTTIDFNIIGGTELIRSNRIYIYDLSDNSLICTHLYVSTESIHELPPNTDGSIVYESGKSSADFVNGAQYYAQIQTYTDTNGTQGGSGLSVAKMFWCLGDPTLTITTIPSTISTTSYNISATYTDTSASVVSNIIQQYQFNLYSATGSLLQSSGVVVGSGTQQGTSAVYDISHNFTGLNVGSSYYVTVDVTTTQGMSVNAQSNTFTVSIDTPTLGEATVVNNACDGYISVTSNLSGEYGGSGSGEIVSFETDSENVFSKLQVDLEPVQEGSGDPSPSNVRPIRGYSGVNVIVAGKNLIKSNIGFTNGRRDDDGSQAEDPIQHYSSPIPVKPNKTYTLSGSMTVSGYGSDVYYLDLYGSLISKAGGFHSTPYSFTTPSNCRYIQIQAPKEAPTSNWQLELGSTATEYEPQAQTTTQDFNATLTPTSTDTTPYLFKAVGDIYGDRLEDKIVGGTVAWNQLVKMITEEQTKNGVNRKLINGEYVFSGTATSQTFILLGFTAGSTFEMVSGHKYLIYGCKGGTDNTYRLFDSWSGLFSQYNSPIIFSYNTGTVQLALDVKNGVNVDGLKIKPQVIDLTQMFGSTIADYIYSLEQSQAGAGVAWFKKLFPNDYYAYNAGELLSVEGLQSHDTVGFNQWDEEWESGYYDPADGAAVANASWQRNVNPMPCLPNTTYYAKQDGGDFGYILFYDADGDYISYANPYESPYGITTVGVVFTTPSNAYQIKFYRQSSSVGRTLNINLSNPSRNGEYEPYEKHSYPLDSSLTLRGIPKLDASNNLYYDGDEYTSDGKVKRKYGIVDLGTLYWVYDASVGHENFHTDISGSYVSNNNVVANIISSRFIATSSNAMYEHEAGDKSMGLSILGTLYVYDSSYTNAEAFKAAMSGVMLIYELATPTTETATPYTNPQIVSKYGTLEYVTNSIVPVGHKTTYLTRDIFGGYVDLISGTLVVDKAMVDLGTLEWFASGTSVSGYNRFISRDTLIEISQDSAIVPDIISSRYVAQSPDNTYVRRNGISNNVNASQLIVYDEAYATVSAAEFKTAMSGVQAVYPLETPQTYQLTPQQVNTLVGTNNVWSEQGNIELSYHIPITNLLVKRQDVDDVSGGWLTLYSQPISQASDMDFTFIDFLNQYGKTYKYALVPLLTQTQSGVEVEVEGGYTVSDEVQSVFDGVFIADSTGSQKCKANVGYGNVDMNQVVGSITPIGAKYPIIITNSHNQYHNGSISGTIVPDDYYFNGNLSRIDMVNKRNELEQFLTNKRVKVIKDWNGNIWLVMIVGNVSCTFNNNYGMGIVSFSTNWTEVGDPTNQQDLQATGLINVGGV